MTWNSRTPNTMFRRLPVEQATGQLYGGRHRLRVVYRTRDLVVLGLGVMVGAGIFKISMVQAAANAGPAVILSFLIAGGVCLLAALAYAELSSIVPVAGSAYSFSYVAFGEVWAWVVGWSLILELLLAASVVARAWSLYAAQVVADFGVPVPDWLGEVIGQPKGFDVFALGILLLLVLLLATGSRLGLRTLWLMVMAKLLVIGLVIGVGLTHFDSGNLTPFVPPARPASGDGGQSVLDALVGAVTGGSPQVFGVWGILAAAPAIAFAYIGFDLIATASEETDDAPRKVPRGIITSLAVAVVLYLGVAVTMVGMVSAQRLDPDKVVLTTPFTMVGADSMGKIINIGAVIALTTVILVVLISLTRVVFSMSRDGLLPRGLASMSRFRVPSRATLAAGGAAVVMSQTIDVLTLEQMVVIGTLFAFLFGCAAVLRLRRDQPDLHRPFRMPAAPLTAVLGIVAIIWLMLNLKVETWAYFGAWMLAGLLLYLAYGRRGSELRALLDRPVPQRPVAAALAAPPPDLARMTGPPPGSRPISTVPPGTPGVPPYQPERFPAGGGARPWTPRIQQPQYPDYPPERPTGPQAHPTPPEGLPYQRPPQQQYPPQDRPRRDHPPQPPYHGGRHRR
ncbi:amino acid permease [Actinomadura sp. NBRC 104412]|uniref:APC family permease n=1 Tax=Actinomadura sp. NBRC 104412 TaxID=3032203 RepID=UPI0024A397A2|nr:amino acid permease [Actinomadura sp. NBRC 104412]GLZ04197.1 amino acid permease [Actinomadura sp. NBRC 104412]